MKTPEGVKKSSGDTHSMLSAEGSAGIKYRVQKEQGGFKQLSSPGEQGTHPGKATLFVVIQFTVYCCLGKGFSFIARNFVPRPCQAAQLNLWAL